LVLGELRLNLTVVIPTLNRQEQVRQRVEELKELNCEIVVVDGSQRPLVVDGARVIWHPQRIGSGEARNVGAEQAQTDWVLFMDDDHVPSPGLVQFIDKLLPNLKTRDVVGFRIVGSSRMGSRPISMRYNGIFRIVNILFGVDISSRSGPSRFVPVAMIFHSKFFASLGGFDSHRYCGNCFREESDLQWRARKMGGRLTFIEDPFFTHLNTPGGHDKRHSKNDVYYMRNHTIFAFRTNRPASLVMVTAFGAYLLAKGIRVSELVRGIAEGLGVVLQD